MSSFATSVVRLSGTYLLVLESDSVRTFHKASSTCMKMLWQVGLGLSGPRGPLSITPGPSSVRGRDPYTVEK